MQRVCHALVYHTCFPTTPDQLSPPRLNFLSILSKKRNYNLEAALCVISPFSFIYLRLCSHILPNTFKKHNVLFCSELDGDTEQISEDRVCFSTSWLWLIMLTKFPNFFEGVIEILLQSSVLNQMLSQMNPARVSLKSTLILFFSAVVSYTWIVIFNETNYVFIWTPCIKKCISGLDAEI